MIRSLFLPEIGHKWGCFDYSQQEPRLVVHYAAEIEPICFDEAVENIVVKFKEGNVDFHKTVADMANISRSQAKTINLGLFYGMGKAKLQAELGLSTKGEAENLFNQYHDNVPFVKELMTYTSRLANQNGYIKTLLGRKCRFDKWEVDEFKFGVMSTPLTKEEAARKFKENYILKYPDVVNDGKKMKQLDDEPKIKRCFTYKALNKLIQGSAADMTKKAMLDLYKEGIIPHIQIHDELDISIKNDSEAKKIVEIMENAVADKMLIPNKVDYESGENWGQIFD
jgi:DNA polymerase I-like protein with 3'-5' exonuclease and polymerase domains